MAELDATNDIQRMQALLGIELDDADKGRVEAYIVQAKQAIMVYIRKYLDDDNFPTELNYLVDQLTLAKYNKFHNEGMNSISEEGLSMTFNSNELKDYLPDIEAWIDSTGKGDLTGKCNRVVLMRYDQTVYLITETANDGDDLNFSGETSAITTKGNVKRTNLTLANGEMYDATIVRVFGNWSADKIGLSDYNPDTGKGARKIQKVGRHFNRTDFYIVNSEVIFNAK